MMDVVSIQPVPYFAAFSSHPVDVQPQRNKRIKVSASLRSVETEPAEEKRRHVFQIPVKGLWSKKEEHEENSAKEGERKEMNKEEMIEKKRRKVNWAMQILRIGLIWQGEKRERPQEEQIADGVEQSDLCVGCCDGGEEGCDYAGDEVEIHKDSFSKLLRRVSLTEARLYERLSVLGNLAYRIPEIKEVVVLDIFYFVDLNGNLMEKKKLISPFFRMESIPDTRSYLEKKIACISSLHLWRRNCNPLLLKLLMKKMMLLPAVLQKSIKICPAILRRRMSGLRHLPHITS